MWEPQEKVVQRPWPRMCGGGAGAAGGNGVFEVERAIEFKLVR